MRYLFLAWLALIGLAQAALAQNEFRYAYGGSRDEIGRSIAAYGRSRFYVWGSSNSNNTASRNNAVLFQTDSLGKLKIYKEFSTPGGHEEGYAMKLVDTTIYLLGTARPATGGTERLVLQAVTLDGNVIWRKEYDTQAARTYPFGLNVLPSGELLVVSSGNFTVGEIYRFSNTGTMLARSQIGNVAQASQLYCVRPTADGNLAVSGMVDNHAYLAKLTLAGTLIWEVEWHIRALTVAKSFVELANGDFFINGYSNNGTRDLMVAKVTQAGLFQWAKFYSRGPLQDVNYGTYLDTDGNPILTGYTYDDGIANSIDYVLAKFNTDGNMVWGKALSGPFDDYVDNGPDHLTRIGPGEYITMGSSGSTADHTQGQDFVLFRFRQTSSGNCFGDNYQLTPVTTNTVVNVTPGAAYSSPGLFSEVATTLQPANGSVCKRVPCRPEINFWDSLGPDLHRCHINFPIQLDAGNLNSHYAWSTGDTTETITVTHEGTYSVLVTSACGTFRDTVTLVSLPANPLPVDSSGPLQFCLPGSVLLSIPGLAVGTPINWSNGATSDTSILVNAGGTYSALVTIDGCEVATDTVTVTPYPTPQRPIISPAPQVQICAEDSVELFITNLHNNNNNYTWNTGLQNSPTLMVDSAGTYAVTAENAYGCRSTSDPTEVVMVLPAAAPTITTFGPSQPCIGDSVTLLAIGADSIRWSTGQVGNFITVFETGLYEAFSTVHSTCPPQRSQPTLVTFNLRPDIHAGMAMDLCEGDSIYLGSPAQPNTAYAWAPAQMFPNANEARQVLVAHAPNTLNDVPLRSTYTLTARSNGCTSVDTVSVLVHSFFELRPDGLPYCGGTLLIPNLITANNDGENDIFSIKLLPSYREHSLEVYDRWGKAVFSQSPYANKWDAGDVPAGLYYYRLRVPKPNWDFKGWVEVVK